VSLGSAIGYYALLAKYTCSNIKIHCFEPLDRHRRYLEENIELNGFQRTNSKSTVWLLHQTLTPIYWWTALSVVS